LYKDNVTVVLTSW